MTLGTGIGGGLIVENRLYRGVSGSAGEIGHTMVLPKGRRCACGSRGCLETQIGAAAIVREAHRAMRRRLSTPAEVHHAAQRGNRAAQRVWADVGVWLGLGITNVVNLLNPERIVIGGGVAKAWRFFYPSLIRTVRVRAMQIPAQAVRIVRARLGDQAGIVGGAVLVWETQQHHV